ncbi:nucleoside deaminase [Mumia sp. zg.B17]|uniref:nucleoside deaminase n=1 Tax=unclassified Mumia TaxID=2621872 RepID=UPI001C6EAEAC|nr:MULTISPECIES: nucleoside deaminase [unclassified Mumia]MBW9205306.1 nucleoside deaminase [Mumia sp. zg.B17]MBW9208695.1 nucleoside deaminase [Mumia sp. zg.B21]MDD9348555.1 nucleoside deaminase [Mumia sp.]
MSSFSDDDLRHLRRCVALAAIGLDEGNEPFGSVLVSADGTVLFEDHNREKDGDHTRHPELAIVRWAVENLEPEDRASATVYTSGEHCAMCSAAHAWVGLGRIVYVVASTRLAALLEEWGVGPSPVAPLPITTVAPGLAVEGPVEALAAEMEALYERCFRPV